MAELWRKEWNVDIKEEEARIRALLESALKNLEEAMESKLWGYTREYELGKLDVAKTVLSSAIEELKP